MSDFQLNTQLPSDGKTIVQMKDFTALFTLYMHMYKSVADGGWMDEWGVGGWMGGCTDG